MRVATSSDFLTPRLAALPANISVSIASLSAARISPARGLSCRTPSRTSFLRYWCREMLFDARSAQVCRAAFPMCFQFQWPFIVVNIEADQKLRKLVVGLRTVLPYFVAEFARRNHRSQLGTDPLSFHSLTAFAISGVAYRPAIGVIVFASQAVIWSRIRPLGSIDRNTPKPSSRTLDRK